MISSLPEKASITLAESQGLPSDPSYVLLVELGKLDIKRPEPCIVVISLQVGSHLKLAIMTLLSIFVLVFQISRHHLKVRIHDDLIKARVLRKTTFINPTYSNAVYMRGNW